MIRKFLPIVMFAFVLVFSSCGAIAEDVATTAAEEEDQGAPELTAGTCTVGTTYCTEYSGSWSGQDVSCGYVSGTWSTAACSTASPVASCLLDTGDGTSMITYYYDTDYATAVESGCVDDEWFTATWTNL